MIDRVIPIVAVGVAALLATKAVAFALDALMLTPVEVPVWVR